MEKDKGLYFIGGIEGVGKTTLTSRAATLLSNTINLTASNIIREKSNIEDIATIPYTQQEQCLIRGISESFKTTNKRLLLDAHYICFEDDKDYEVVKDDFWQETKAFIHISSNVDSIYKRSTRDEIDGIKKRSLNDLPSIKSIEEISRRQELSRKEAVFVAKHFNKPLIHLMNNESLKNVTNGLIMMILSIEDTFRNIYTNLNNKD